MSHYDTEREMELRERDEWQSLVTKSNLKPKTQKLPKEGKAVDGVKHNKKSTKYNVNKECSSGCINCVMEEERFGLGATKKIVEGGPREDTSILPPKEWGDGWDTGKIEMFNDVNKARHYNQHPSAECIDVVEHFDFCIGNVIKYCWRAGLKSENALKDLRKARYYIDRKIKLLEKE